MKKFTSHILLILTSHKTPPTEKPGCSCIISSVHWNFAADYSDCKERGLVTLRSVSFRVVQLLFERWKRIRFLPGVMRA